MKCPHCNQEHPEGTNYCPITGDLISLVKLHCTNSGCEVYNKPVLPSDSVFCPYCGTKLPVGVIKIGDAEAQYKSGKRFLNDKKYNEAIKCFRKAAVLDFADAQVALGNCYHNGSGVTKNDIEAIKWYRKAAENNHADAQYLLGKCYFNGNGVRKDVIEAIKWYRKAAENNHAEAQFILGDFYYDGDYVSEDENEAAKWYKKAAEQGHVEAQNSLGECYDYGIGLTQDHKKAEFWYQKAAEQDYAEAMYNLAFRYSLEEDNSVYYDEIVKWFSKAAKLGHIEAQVSLGKFYLKRNEYKKAYKWFIKAAENGNVESMCYTGNCYYLGNGVARNYGEAVKWYRKAATQGNTEAQTSLGKCYYDGKGVEKNYDEAVKLFTDAAEKDDAEAMFYLGECYYWGNGVKKSSDKVSIWKASIWYGKAAEKGNSDAQFCFARYLVNKKNYKDANIWLRKASNQGHKKAKTVLAGWLKYNYYKDSVFGRTYFKPGDEESINGKKEAVKLYRELANDGDVDAMFEIADSYENGIGVDEDIKAAKSWYERAANKGNAMATEKLKDFRKIDWWYIVPFIISSLIMSAVFLLGTNVTYLYSFIRITEHSIKHHTEPTDVMILLMCIIAFVTLFATIRFFVLFIKHNPQKTSSLYNCCHLCFLLIFIAVIMTLYNESKLIHYEEIEVNSDIEYIKDKDVYLFVNNDFSEPIVKVDTTAIPRMKIIDRISYENKSAKYITEYLSESQKYFEIPKNEYTKDFWTCLTHIGCVFFITFMYILTILCIKCVNKVFILFYYKLFPIKTIEDKQHGLKLL